MSIEITAISFVSFFTQKFNHQLVKTSDKLFAVKAATNELQLYGERPLI